MMMTLTFGIRKKNWYYGVVTGKEYNEGDYSDGLSNNFSPSREGREQAAESWRYFIYSPFDAIADSWKHSDIWKTGYFTTYWELTSYQQGAVDGGFFTSFVDALPTVALSSGLGVGALSYTRSLGGLSIPVYRVYGGQAGRFGNYWTPINPKLYGGTYRNFAGLPNSNSGAFLLKGYIQLNNINGIGLAKPIPSSGTFGRLVIEFRINNSWNNVLWTPLDVIKTKF